MTRVARAPDSARQRGVHRRGEELADVAVQAQGQPRIAIVVGDPAVDDDVRHAPLGSRERDRGGRMNRQARAQRDDQVGPLGGGKGL